MLKDVEHDKSSQESSGQRRYDALFHHSNFSLSMLFWHPTLFLCGVVGCRAAARHRLDFKSADHSGDGLLDLAELATFMHSTAAVSFDLLMTLDTDHDRYISFAEMYVIVWWSVISMIG